jgi:hypothetical protein
MADVEALVSEIPGAALSDDPDAGSRPPMSAIFSTATLDEMGRLYALYRDSLDSREAALASCEAVLTPEEYAQFCAFLSSLEQVRSDLGDCWLDHQLVPALEPSRVMIGEVQPRELARRRALDLVDLAEAWAVDGAAWLAPAGQTASYWVGIASSQIIERAGTAWTRTGRQVKLDQANYVIRRVQRNQQSTGDSEGVAFCTALLELLKTSTSQLAN